MPGLGISRSLFAGSNSLTGKRALPNSSLEISLNLSSYISQKPSFTKFLAIAFVVPP